MKRLLALVLALSGCDDEVPPCGLTAVLEVPGTGGLVGVDACTATVSLGDATDPVRWLSPLEGRPALAWADDDVAVTMQQGRYVYDGLFGAWNRPGDGAFADGGWAADDGSMSLAWSVDPRGAARLSVTGPPGADRVSIAFACDDSERWFGLGARPDGTDHTGKSSLLVTAEQGIGQDDYPLDEINLLRGRTGDSYFPVPWVVSTSGAGIAIDGTPIAGVDLCEAGFQEDSPRQLRFEAWGSSMDLLLFPAESPREAVAAWTLFDGPPAAAPDWAYGPWIGVQRGTAELQRTAELLRRLRIPTTALWAQDWIGGRENSFGGYDLPYHWEWDEELYPGLPAAIDGLHAQGYAFLSYFNPFITEPHRELEEAEERGYLPLTPEGEPYTFAIVDRFGSVVDLHNPEAWAWAKEYLVAAAEMGHDGWMCDFAEWMPFDAQVGDGLLGRDIHNEVPVLWHELNMEVLNEVLGEGNGLCFGRSGWTGDWRHTPVTWGGDQETSFSRDDGIATAREIGVGLGLSGVGRYGSDIAGFSSSWDGASTRELYLRWLSMGAFEPVMRTHDGLAEDENWHWEADQETLLTLRRYARLHLRLQPLWRALNADYVQRGLPMMRHSVLVDGSELLRDAPDQHFLGDDLIVAPVLERGALSRDVALPAGAWYGLLDGGYWAQEEPAVVSVDAPVTEIPVFARAGSLLPMLDPEVVTTYPSTDPDVVDAADRADRIDLLAFAGGEGSFTLAGGGVFTWSGDVVGPASVQVDGEDGGLNVVCTDPRSWNCTESFDAAAGVASYRVEWGDEARTLSGDGWELHVEGGRGRRGVLTLRFAPEG